MARAGADAGEAELVQDLADRALVGAHAKARRDDLPQILPPPAHDAVHGRIRSCLDEVSQVGLLLRREAGRAALGPGAAPRGTAAPRRS